MEPVNDSHILVVDDDQEIRELTCNHLKKRDYRVSSATNAKEARGIIQDSAIDLVVLDVMMPGEDGLSLCRHIIETSEIPVILLTALSGETDRVVGLELGADDYICKPFSIQELNSRIKAVLRRANALPKIRQSTVGRNLAFDRWVLDANLRELTDKNGVVVALSSTESALLVAFLEHPRHILNRDQLLDLTQGRFAKAFDRTIDNQVSRLRHKVEMDPKDPKLIVTEWGGGYRLAVDVTKV